MHLIVGILIGIVFFFLLGKAIIETFWGLCLIAYGIGCHILAFALRGLAKIVRAYGRLKATASW